MYLVIVRVITIGSILLFSACARFQHQTGPLEPHAVIAIPKRIDFSGEVGVVKKIDGLAVRPNRAYRVKPGEHAVVIQFATVVTQTVEVEDGQLEITRIIPTYITNSILVRTGWVYELDGLHVYGKRALD